MTQKQRQEYQKLHQLVYYLQKEYWPFEEIDKNIAFAQVANFGESIFNLDPADPNFLPNLANKILGQLSLPIEQETTNIPPNLKEMVAEYEKAKNEQQTKKNKFISLDEQKKTLYKRFSKKIEKVIIKNDPALKQNPELVSEISQDLSEKIIEQTTPVAKPEFFDTNLEKEYQQKIDDLKPFVYQTTLKAGSPIQKDISLEIGQQTLPEIKQIAAEPKIIQPIKEGGLTDKGTAKTAGFQPLPPEIIQKIEAQQKIIPFSPVLTILHPKAAIALGQRTIYSPAANLLKMAAPEMSEEWRQMALKGLFIEDLKTSVKAFEKMGLPKDHQVFKYLQEKIAKFEPQQKITTDQKTWQDQMAAKIFKSYYRFGKITGKIRIYDDKLGTYLPQLEPNTLWSSKKGYANFLKEGLDKFSFITKTYQRFAKFITKGKFDSFGSLFKQKVIRPALVKLGKTAFGKAIKGGFKKVAVKVATKLGIKIGVAAAGAAIPGPGWVAAVIAIGSEVLGFLKNLISKIARDPEKALMALGVGILGLVFLPLPIALIAVVPLIIGTIGVVSFVVAPTTIGAFGAGLSGFFGLIAVTAPFSIAAITLFVIILFGALIGLTIFIIMIASGAFILPEKISEATTTTISPYFSQYFELKKTVVGNTKYDEPPDSITYKISLKPKKGILKRPTLTEEIKVGKEGSAPTITPHHFDDLPPEIDASGWETEYTINLDNRFEDSAIINTIKLSTSVEDVEGSYQGIASATVIIGEPPGDCPPFPWPTTGRITQGPEGGTSHGPKNSEAIDIGNIVGTPVYATHNGTAVAYHQEIGGGYYVKIYGNCNGIDYETKYFHLLQRDRVEGPVSRGQIIGYMDSSGGYYKSHLHYEFGPTGNPPFKMEPPNIPTALPYRECDSSTECNITIN